MRAASRKGTHMGTPTIPRSKFARLDEVQERLGHVPLSRIVTDPAPGTATVQDLLDSSITKGRLCELVDGILVEKPTGFNDDRIGTRLIHLIASYLDTNNIGEVAGAQGMIRFKLDRVRIPDVSFIRWDSVDDPQVIENPAGAFLEVPPTWQWKSSAPATRKAKWQSSSKSMPRPV